MDSRKDFCVDLLGPTRPDYKWQAQEGTGFAAEHFVIDWEPEVATCPAGKTSISRYVGHARTHLQHVLTAAAINFVRVDRWLCDVPRQDAPISFRHPDEGSGLSLREFASGIKFAGDPALGTYSCSMCGEPFGGLVTADFA